MKKGRRIAVLVCGFLLVTSLVTAAAVNNPAATAPMIPQASGAPAASEAAGEPAGTRLIGSEAVSSAETALNREAIEALVGANRLFGEDLYDEEALLGSVEILLLDQSIEIDGFRYLDRELARRTVLALYGRTLSDTVGEIYGMPAPDGYYAILPCGYDRMEHTVTEIQPQADGRLAVTSQLLIVGLDSTEQVQAVTILSPAEDEYGYIITAASLVE